MRQQKVLPPLDAPCDGLDFKQDGKQKLLLSVPAARVV
jgi:hypothetical protein